MTLVVAMLAMVLVAAGSALAQEAAAPGPGRPGGPSVDNLGLEGITVTSTTLDKKTKEVTVSGTVTCSSPLSVFVQSSVRQDVGRFNTVWGMGGTEVACDGETPFSLTISPFKGRFGGGSAEVFAGAFASTELGLDAAETDPIDTKLSPSR